MQKLHVGVIGTGRMGERHCRIYSNLPQIEFVGASDLSQERGRQVTERYGTNFYQDYRQLLPQLDAVTIASSTATHFPLALECLERGLHVLVEKPIAETVEQGERLVQEARARNLVLQVGHIERFNPTYIELKNVIEDRQIIAINMRRLSSFDTSNTDVDVILDLMIHDLDLAIDMLGDSPDQVNAWGRSIHGAVDHAVTNLSYQNGPIATLMASRITEQKIRALDVVADGAYIEADFLNKNIAIHRRNLAQFLENQVTVKYRQESIIELISVPMTEPLLLEVQNFVDAANGEADCGAPGYDGVSALRLASQIADQITQSPFVTL